jgi:hypothetical protein
LGSAFATTSAPIVVSAPGRFSITTGLPHDTAISRPMMRDRMSVGPPAGNGTMMWIGRLG